MANSHHQPSYELKHMKYLFSDMFWLIFGFFLGGGGVKGLSDVHCIFVQLYVHAYICTLQAWTDGALLRTTFLGSKKGKIGDLPNLYMYFF